jgi:hypothetical protein
MPRLFAQNLVSWKMNEHVNFGTLFLMDGRKKLVS